MKKIVALLFLVATLMVTAKDINIGDSITLKLSGVSKEKAVEAFKESDFSVESIKDDKDGNVLLVVKGFKTGENTIRIGNKDIVFHIKSVLTPEDKEIYLDLADESNKELYLHRFPYILVISGAVGLVALIFLLKGIKRQKRTKSIDPDERFKNHMDILSEDNWAFDISYAVREYIDSRYQLHFMNGIYEKAGKLEDEDIAFIQWLDDYKFSLGNENHLEASRDKAFEIYNKIKEGKENV